MKNIAFSTIDEYIALQPEEYREGLQHIRRIIREAAPEAEEIISYQMPGFRFHGMVAWFAVTKSHYGLYVVPEVLEVFRKKLTGYEFSKSAIRLPLDQPLPENLITAITTEAVNRNLEKKYLKNLKKRKT